MTTLWEAEEADREAAERARVAEWVAEHPDPVTAALARAEAAEVALADLIRERDAELREQVRAEMLADVHNIARVSTLTGTDVRLIIEAIRETNGLHWETSATLAGKWGGPFRRLVGPWTPAEP